MYLHKITHLVPVIKGDIDDIGEVIELSPCGRTRSTFTTDVAHAPPAMAVAMLCKPGCAVRAADTSAV